MFVLQLGLYTSRIRFSSKSVRFEKVPSLNLETRQAQVFGTVCSKYGNKSCSMKLEGYNSITPILVERNQSQSRTCR